MSIPPIFEPNIEELLLPFEINVYNLALYSTIDSIKKHSCIYYREILRLYNEVINIKNEIGRKYSDELTKSILQINVGQCAEDELTKSILHINVGQCAEDELNIMYSEDIKKNFISHKMYFQSVPKHLISFAANNNSQYINVLIVSPNSYKYNNRPYILNSEFINNIDKSYITTEYNTLRVTEIEENKYKIQFFKNETEHNGSEINVYVFNTPFPSTCLQSVRVKPTRNDKLFVINFYKNLNELFDLVNRLNGVVSCFSYAIYRLNDIKREHRLENYIYNLKPKDSDYERALLNKYRLFKDLTKLFDNEKISFNNYIDCEGCCKNKEECDDCNEQNRKIQVENVENNEKFTFRLKKYRLLARLQNFDFTDRMYIYDKNTIENYESCYRFDAYKNLKINVDKKICMDFGYDDYDDPYEPYEYRNDDDPSYLYRIPIDIFNKIEMVEYDFSCTKKSILLRAHPLTIFKQKYLKYKQKYLNLKNKIK